VHFKRLEMVGFKSFVDHTCLDFEAGITAVVGPNGCGKSNVVDSIRWVLGETSAKALRGARMEDVIFNGTDQRKAVGMAEVSLTIDNHDHFLPTEHDEVTLTRRTYRSGESEYLLNKVNCRLRDIHDLLSNTGLGTNAYSFLEQGKIDLIVSSKPGDRRFVFEEAAGIAKYRSRREESTRKLEATEQNFLRVNDIAVEVKRQIGTLERQAQKARRYQELKQELTTLEVSRGRKELTERRRALRKLEHAWEERLSSIRELENQKETLEMDVAAFDEELSVLDAALTQAQASAHRVAEEMIKAEEFVTSSELRQEDLQLGLTRLDAEMAEFREKEVLLRSQSTQIFESRQAKEQELAQLKTTLGQDEARLTALENEMKERAMRVQDQQNRLLTLVDQMSTLRGTLKNLEVRRGEHEQRWQQLEQRLGNLNQQRTQVLQEKQTYENEGETLADAALNLETEKSSLLVEKERLEKTLATLENMIANFGQTITQLQARVNWIEELKNGLDGYELGAKTILLEHNAHPERFPGVLGPVANFMRTDKKYEFAFEALLGHGLQHILVQSETHAREAMAFLAEGNRGRATFIPMDAFSGQENAEPATADGAWMNLPGVIGLARSLVKIDERFCAMFDRLLAQTVLVNDYATLRQVRAAGAQGILVTLNGEIETMNGWLTGGSSDIPERGLLGREREIEELQNELILLQKNSTSAQTEAQTLAQRLEEITGGLSANDAELHKLQIRLTKTEKSLEQVLRQGKELEQQTSALQQERDQTFELCRTLQAEHADAEKELLNLELYDRQTQEALSQHQIEIEARRQEYDDRALHAGELRISLAALSQQVSNCMADAERVMHELHELERRLDEKRETRERDQVRIVELASQMQQRRELLLQLETEKASRDLEVRGFQNKRHEVVGQKESYAQELRTRQRRLDEAKQQQHQLELEKRQLEYNLKSLEEYLQTEYHLTLSLEEEHAALPAPGETTEEAAQPAAEVLDPKAAQARIQEIKDKLSSMGSVNLVAMEEYQELQQRYEFLTKQLDDLKESKESLQRLISKINQESRARFLETFTQVQEKFREVFRRLFNGGDAELILIDENNLLETGIEIIARPPGKRLQNITLLSGGEKALTAIALLFAIFLIKPSPFCIFDEMDAPLDDTNTVRFGRILQEFAKRSQFIVISHNKITMEKADVLYGVTMQEPGVSKLVSVKFKGQNQAQPIAESSEKMAELAAAN
jgi:chromosome segregation protein